MDSPLDRPDNSSRTLFVDLTPAPAPSATSDSLSGSTTSDSRSQLPSATSAGAGTSTSLVVVADSGGGSNSDKIALGVGVSFGLLATGIGVVGLIISWKQQMGVFAYRRHCSHPRSSLSNLISRV